MAIFKIPMSAVSISTVQDLWHIKAGATYPLLIHGTRPVKAAFPGYSAREKSAR